MPAQWTQAEMLVIEVYNNTRQPGPLTTGEIEEHLAPRLPNRTVVAIISKLKKVNADARALRQGNVVPQGRIAAVRTDIRWTDDEERRLVERFQQVQGSH